MDFDYLLKKAYDLVLEDRETAIGAYEDLRGQIATNPEAAYFLGTALSSFLDTATKATANLVKLTAILARDRTPTSSETATATAAEFDRLLEVLDKRKIGPPKMVDRLDDKSQ